MVICLERGADLHMAQLMPLPLTVSCFSKIQIDFTFLVPAHQPGQRADKRVCECHKQISHKILTISSSFLTYLHWILTSIRRVPLSRSFQMTNCRRPHDPVVLRYSCAANRKTLIQPLALIHRELCKASISSLFIHIIFSLQHKHSPTLIRCIVRI